jgi:hypothetical protein
MEQNFEYDIAFSYAGEDRNYVEKVAIYLKANNVRVFYDRFEEVNLWGKNLYTYLSGIYKDQAEFTVMFISKDYAKKLWTNHERESAQARAFKENKEYILPARFDSTEIPGVLGTTGYIDLTKYLPEEFGLLICKKINLNNSSGASNLISSNENQEENYNQSIDSKKISLKHMEKLIVFANSGAGMGMSIYDARNWVTANFLTISNKYPIDDYIREMEALIVFANSGAGLGLSIYDARNWANTNFDKLKNEYGTYHYISIMYNLIIFANSGSGLGLSINDARNWASNNIKEYQKYI